MQGYATAQFGGKTTLKGALHHANQQNNNVVSKTHYAIEKKFSIKLHT